MPSFKQKCLALCAAVLVLGVTTFSFAVFHNEDGTDTVAFLLTDQYGQRKTHEDYSSKPLLVFFGFTSCADICPMGLHTLATVMTELAKTNQQDEISTIMITVDPERDTGEKLKSYLANFNKSFIGLRGSRVALENVAAEFNTFLDKPPEHIHGQVERAPAVNHNSHSTSQSTDLSTHEHSDAHFIENYQLTHSSVVYLVDTYSRVVDTISLDDVDDIVKALRNYLATTTGQRHG